jgi:hypothetical protein
MQIENRSREWCGEGLPERGQYVRLRVMPDLNRIPVDPEICHGKPTICGLRYPVSMILELLASAALVRRGE